MRAWGLDAPVRSASPLDYSYSYSLSLTPSYMKPLS